jgi:hypothetical protein
MAPDMCAVSSRTDIDSLDEQLHDARPLGGDQVVPERIEPI